MSTTNLSLALLGAGSALDEHPNGLNYSLLDLADPSRNDSLNHYMQVPGMVNGSGLLNATDMHQFEISTVSNCWFNDSECNMTATNGSDTNLLFNPLPLWQMIFFGTLASITSLMTIFGNTVVILSFVLERQIRQPTNYFIASLAVSDLLIGSISMPLYTVYLLAGKAWPLGEFLCDMWLSVDYTLCLTSIYTVFCITIDRFCSVNFPAKYRNWRTDRKVMIIIINTWVIPTGVFFTSIIGWQYFVGVRTVEPGRCYVQYMDEALFNTILQVGYFWITLIVMCILYTGIYRVALKLQRKSDAKHKKMTSLVSMAGQTMTKIGIGMSQQNKNLDAAKFFPENGNTLGPPKKSPNMSTDPTTRQGTSSTSFSSSKNNDKDEDRSSSPAFPSDTEPSSQSPKRSPNPKRQKKSNTKKPKKNSTCAAALVVPKLAPPKNEKRIYKMERHLPNAIASNGSRCLNLGNIPLPPVHQSHNDNNTVNPKPALPPPSCPSHKEEEDEEDPGLMMKACESHGCPNANDSHSSCSDSENEALLSHKCEGSKSKKFECHSDDLSPVKAMPTEMDELVHLNKESVETVTESSDNPRQSLLLSKDLSPVQDDDPANPDSPIWKRRDSFVQRINDNRSHGSMDSLNSIPDTPLNTPNTLRDGSIKAENALELQSQHVPPNSPASAVTFSPIQKHPVNIQVHATAGSKSVSTLARNDDISPLNAVQKDDNRKRLQGLVPYIRSLRKHKKNKKKDKRQSKSENRAKKALRTITIILGAFVLCWTPWHVLSLIIGFRSGSPGVVESVLYDISYYLCYLNSPINPLCYAFANQQFKKTFIRILKLDWHKT